MVEIDEKEKKVVENEKEEPKKEMAQKWEAYVRNELNTLLDIYLPIAIEGTVGINYVNPVKAKYETHTVYNKTVACGVQLNIVFTFGDLIDVPKEKK